MQQKLSISFTADFWSEYSILVFWQSDFWQNDFWQNDLWQDDFVVR